MTIEPVQVGMRAGNYKPHGINLTRYSHNLVSLVRPEIRLTDLRVAEIIIDQTVIVSDTSSYDGIADFAAMLEAGAAGVYVRGGQGFLIDAQFNTSQQNVVKVNLPDGYYWLLDPRFEPTQQADKFWNAVKAHPGRLPLVVDYEAPDSWGGNYRGWKSLYAFLERLKSLCGGLNIMIYVGYYYWLEHSPNPITQSASLQYFAQYPLWLPWYTEDFSIIKIPAPWRTVEFLQYTDSGSWPIGQDRSYFNGDLAAYKTRYHLDINLPPPVVTHVIEIDLAVNELQITPSVIDTLPLLTPQIQAEMYGWTGAMNAGAGFDYTDATHARVKGTSVCEGVEYSNDPTFESYSIDDKNQIPYARRMISGSVLNPALDDAYKAPWSMLGLKGGKAYFIVTEGQEGASGVTQMQAAKWGAFQMGFTDLFLFDFGHSCGLAKDGLVIYSAYNEPVPQCIGYRAKTQTGGATMKGTALVDTNIKPVAGGVAIDTLHVGEVVYGEYNSSIPLTDLMNVTKVYNADGVFVNRVLSVPCKVSVGNLKVEPGTEPGGTLPPPPSTAPVLKHTFKIYDNGSYQIDDGPITA